jgi:hypothetical protein
VRTRGRKASGRIMAKTTLRGLFTQNRHEQLSSRVDLIERLLESIVEGEEHPTPVPWDVERLRTVIRRPGGGPGPVADPGPSDEARLRTAVHRPIADPAVSDLRRPGWVDPAVSDRTRPTAADLQAELHQISAEKVRLDAREREVQRRLAEMLKGTDAPKEG